MPSAPGGVNVLQPPSRSWRTTVGESVVMYTRGDHVVAVGTPETEVQRLHTELRDLKEQIAQIKGGG